MPRTKTAKKELRKNHRNNERNTARHKALKTVLKTYQKLITEKKTDEAKSYLPKVYKALDKMAKVDFIKKNKARRLKSRLSKKLVVKK